MRFCGVVMRGVCLEWRAACLRSHCTCICPFSLIPCVAVVGKLGENHLRAPYNRWFNSDKFGIFVVLIVFSVR